MSDKEDVQAALEIKRRLEVVAMSYDRDQYCLDFFLPKNVKFDKAEEFVDITVTTQQPDKWRFVDLESGRVFRFAHPQERAFPNQQLVEDAFCEFRAPSGFWHHAR